METIGLICMTTLYIFLLISMISYKHFQASLRSWNTIMEITMKDASEGYTDNWIYYKSKTGDGTLAWRSYSLWKKAIIAADK